MKDYFFSNAKGFSEQFSRFLKSRSDSKHNISGLVGDIINDVRNCGDAAVYKYTAKFDNVDLNRVDISFSQAEIKRSIEKCDPQDVEAVKKAIERIEEYHKKQMPKNVFWKDELGVELGWFWRPIVRSGVYAPGGKASYPSSVIMNTVPAKVAGVEDIILTSPTPNGEFNPLSIYAAFSLDVKTILRIGGAQAIAALAFGTESIKKVDKITGPGNEYVAEAKRQVFGKVGIDSVAGPSEVLLICDNSMPARLAAIDLLSQAEHDEMAQSILITNDHEYAMEVEVEVERYLNKLKRKDIARYSWKNFGAIVIVPELKKAIDLSNIIAPEHLQLCFCNAQKYLSNIKSAGSVFLGHWSPEAMGDYITGSNHILPTHGPAKFSSSQFLKD